MGKIIDRIRQREARRVGRMLVQIEHERLVRMLEAHPAFRLGRWLHSVFGRR